MFAKLTGTIDHIEAGRLILDVNGVGYLVAVSNRTLDKIGSKGDQVGLWIETIVREDQISLFGFADVVEKDWFNLLCTVQGVGAKAALAILAVVSPEDLPVVISAQDKAAITRADGIGPKLATRIVTELKEKAGKMVLGHAASQAAQGSGGGSVSGGGGRVQVSSALAANSDAVSALVNLGYGRAEAFSTVTAVSQSMSEGEDVKVDVQTLIRESLKELSA